MLATLQTGNASADVIGAIAFEFDGDTYVVEGRDAVGNAYATSAVIQLTGVTDITGLSTTAAATVIDIT